MVLMTVVARLADGLPLAASVQEDEQTGRNLQEYQAQAKQLFRQLNAGSPTQCTVETGPFMFHYLIADGVVYLTLTEREFSKKLAFSYLNELRSEFFVQYGTRLETVSRPYSFIEFDTYIQKARRQYTDSRARSKLAQVQTELQDVQRIMVQNIDDVLVRGVQISALDTKASALAEISEKYRKDAKFLNMRSGYFKIGAIVIFALLVLLYFRFWWM